MRLINSYRNRNVVLLDKIDTVSDVSYPVIAMVAGEASGDMLGSELIQSLKLRYPNAHFVGIGGPKMIALGFESCFSMEKLSVMGFVEVLKNLRELLKIRKSLIQQLIDIRPDVFIGIDAPDFNFKVESELKKRSVTTIHYVGPSVWAWREKRLKKIREYVDGVLVLFPFEPNYYHRYDIPVKFVGHPLANQIPEKPNKLNARLAFKLGSSDAVTAILPGSRMSEIDKMADIYIQSAKLLSETYPNMHYLIPCVHKKARKRVQQAVDMFGMGLKVKLVDAQVQQVLEACDQALVTSGTATLESALMQCPLVLAIKVHPISYFIIKHLVTIPWIGLPNILANESLISELIQGDATPQKIAIQLAYLITDSALRERQLLAFKKQHDCLKQNASELATDAIIDWADFDAR